MTLIRPASLPPDSRVGSCSVRAAEHPETKQCKPVLVPLPPSFRSRLRLNNSLCLRLDGLSCCDSGPCFACLARVPIRPAGQLLVRPSTGPASLSSARPPSPQPVAHAPTPRKEPIPGPRGRTHSEAPWRSPPTDQTRGHPKRGVPRGGKGWPCPPTGHAEGGRDNPSKPW